MWGILLVVGSAVAGPFDAGDCVLCHTIPGHAPASQDTGCATCHQWIRAVAGDPGRRVVAQSVFPLWDRYEKNVASYLSVPDLQAAARLEADWVADWLADPHDVRPGLPEGMPRFGLDAETRASIAAALVAMRPSIAPQPPPDPAHLARGAMVFQTAGCAGCHAFGAVSPDGGQAMAPDLQFTRERMHPDVVAAWIESPSRFSPNATMPAIPLSTEDRLAVRDFVLLADTHSVPALPRGPVPAATTTPVTWTDVEERVFGRVCVHCHMDPSQNDGRAGPGNAGGFGWAATGLELQNWESVRDNEARIVAALLRRRDESARDTLQPGQSPAEVARPERPGMPLGLPAVSDEDLALVLGWYAQGAPR